MNKIRSKCKISDYNDFTIVGNGATVVEICHNSKSMLGFANISILQVSNITLVNSQLQGSVHNTIPVSSCAIEYLFIFQILH